MRLPDPSDPSRLYLAAEGLLRDQPRATLRWLRARLGLSQEAFAERVDVSPKSVKNWEAGRRAIGPGYRATLAALLVPHLATPKGAAFARELAVPRA